MADGCYCFSFMHHKTLPISLTHLPTFSFSGTLADRTTTRCNCSINGLCAEAYKRSHHTRWRDQKITHRIKPHSPRQRAKARCLLKIGVHRTSMCGMFSRPPSPTNFQKLLCLLLFVLYWAAGDLIC